MDKQRLQELAGVITEAYDPHEALDTALHNVASALVMIAVKESGGDKRKVKSNFISLIQDVQEQIRGFAGPMLVDELSENVLTEAKKELSREQVTKAVAKMAAEQAVVIVDEIADGGDHFYPPGIEEWLEEQGLTRDEMNFVYKSAADKLLKKVK